eukprot:8981191-Pyramimonas_sp.AAC.1
MEPEHDMYEAALGDQTEIDEAGALGGALETADESFEDLEEELYDLNIPQEMDRTDELAERINGLRREVTMKSDLLKRLEAQAAAREEEDDEKLMAEGDEEEEEEEEDAEEEADVIENAEA